MMDALGAFDFTGYWHTRIHFVRPSVLHGAMLESMRSLIVIKFIGFCVIQVAHESCELIFCMVQLCKSADISLSTF